MVDSKCNFVTCEFVTISTSNNRSRIVILIYNIYIIYLYKLLLLIICNLIFLSHLPSSISNLLNVTNSHVTKYNSQNVSFLVRLIVFQTVRTVRSFVRSKALALQTMALCAINYGSFLLKVPQTLIAGTSFSDSGNVKRW